MKKSILIALFTMVLFENSDAQSWYPVGKRRFSTGDAIYTSIAFGKGNTPYVVYGDYAKTGNPTVMQFDGAAWVSVGSPGFANGALPKMAIAPDGSIYVVYVEYTGRLNGPTSVMKYNGSSWEPVGSSAFSVADVIQPKIAVDNSGTPYVAYIQTDSTSSLHGYVTVMKFNGTSWVTVGSPNFSNGVASSTSIAIDGYGTPYVVYDDGANSSKATVMKFDGSNWVNVGSAGFSLGNAAKAAITIDKDNTPFVVYEDRGTFGGTIFLNGKATVMKYTGSSWVTVGTPGFSAGDHVFYPSIAVDGNGVPFVVYEDMMTSTSDYGYSTSMKFDGSSWVNVGDAGFSGEGAGYTSISLDSGGIPYVVWAKSEMGSGPVTVMKFGNNTGIKPVAGKNIEPEIIFPNPNNGKFNLIVSSDYTKDVQVGVFSCTGEKIKDLHIEPNKPTGICVDLPSGVYFLVINRLEGITWKTLIIKS